MCIYGGENFRARGGKFCCGLRSTLYSFARALDSLKGRRTLLEMRDASSQTRIDDISAAANVHLPRAHKSNTNVRERERSIFVDNPTTILAASNHRGRSTWARGREFKNFSPIFAEQPRGSGGKLRIKGDSYEGEKEYSPSSRAFGDNLKFTLFFKLTLVPLAHLSSLCHRAARASSHFPLLAPFLFFPPPHSILYFIGCAINRELDARSIINIPSGQIGALFTHARMTIFRCFC